MNLVWFFSEGQLQDVGSMHHVRAIERKVVSSVVNRTGTYRTKPYQMQYPGAKVYHQCQYLIYDTSTLLFIYSDSTHVMSIPHVLYCIFTRFVAHDNYINWKHFSRNRPLFGEFTGHRWIPLKKARDAELWCFTRSATEQIIEQTIETLVIWDASVIVMIIWLPSTSEVNLGIQ